ncbi:hypothetical protein OIDMADRAFT_204669 [Oidiodendron maius Zn]|uniref:Uncharacterized protein n=1 Tax=Oidiodendron maius (strain Zn) TaxID=913774 RepID=A0A0C3H310_OIDMZ|nr:hypothetical protein OIDMADRAFT_204669 [Oidiodendron maius Zn]
MERTSRLKKREDGRHFTWQLGVERKLQCDCYLRTGLISMPLIISKEEQHWMLQYAMEVRKLFNCYSRKGQIPEIGIL